METNRRKSSATNADFAHLLRATHTFAIFFHLSSSFSILSLSFGSQGYFQKCLIYTHDRQDITSVAPERPFLSYATPICPRSKMSILTHVTFFCFLCFLFFFLLFSLDSPSSRPARYIRSASLYITTLVTDFN